MSYEIVKDPSQILCRYWILQDKFPIWAKMTLRGAKRYVKKLKMKRVVYKEK